MGALEGMTNGPKRGEGLTFVLKEYKFKGEDGEGEREGGKERKGEGQRKGGREEGKKRREKQNEGELVVLDSS